MKHLDLEPEHPPRDLLASQSAAAGASRNVRVAAAGELGGAAAVKVGRGATGVVPHSRVAPTGLVSPTPGMARAGKESRTDPGMARAGMVPRTLGMARAGMESRTDPGVAAAGMVPRNVGEAAAVEAGDGTLLDCWELNSSGAFGSHHSWCTYDDVQKDDPNLHSLGSTT